MAKPTASPSTKSYSKTAKKPDTGRTTGRHTRKAESAPTQPISQALGTDVGAISADLHRHLSYTLGRDHHSVNDRYRYQATVLATRDRLMERWKATHAAYYASDCKRAYYLSMEFLMGRALGNALINLGIQGEMGDSLRQLGMGLEDIAEQEPDAGLGNGGLGRLAACFMDSCATLQLPVFGYGIRYDYGMFRQKLVNGAQVEEPDHWLAHGSPWELCRPEYSTRIAFGGRSEMYRDEHGNIRFRTVGSTDVLAVPYDVPVPGYRNGTVNTLRLWKATSPDVFNLSEFNAGDYDAAIQSQAAAENISRVLYPNDKSENGKELRLRQQYFLSSASLQDIVRRWVSVHGADFSQFAAKNICQLNDTHPTVAVAELMRILMDDYGLGWDEAWGITTKCMAYTNHTLLPEALEKWPVALFRHLVPRVLEIIFEINARFMRLVANKWPGDGARQARMSIIEEGRHPQVRMAYLAIVGSCSVNGVAQLHSDLLKAGLFRDFAELWPERFNNKTNGVTQRRWMALCNPKMSKLITDVVGEKWVTDLAAIAPLAKKAKDAGFRAEWRKAKRANKVALAEIVKRDCGVDFNPDAMFDVQVKRIHEYKRQLLNALHLVHLYDRIKRGDGQGILPRCSLFGGKAAPGYQMAKSIIRFITSVADVINADPDVRGTLQVAYIPDYRVSLMERICPAADLSEQISTAGKEASGTGNMKFMMNGALTIGTLDGANIEIREEVMRHGDGHFFLFGHTEPSIAELRPTYRAADVIAKDQDLARVLELIRSGHFNQCQPGIFDEILHSLTDWNDYWFTCADFTDYKRAQAEAETAYRDQERWAASSIYNTAASGKFSTDRTMSEYNREIWKLEPVKAFPV
ncbi:MAG: glycogen/starch/alpha-glucan phosphorylase [Planctomycetota bacterium]|jgi:starch phosphorylase